MNSSKMFSDPRKRTYANKTLVMLSESCILKAAEGNQMIMAEVPKSTNRILRIAEALKVQAQIGTRGVKALVINHCLMHDQVIDY